jgi:hypothetical protein
VERNILVMPKKSVPKKTTMFKKTKEKIKDIEPTVIERVVSSIKKVKNIGVFKKIKLTVPRRVILLFNKVGLFRNDKPGILVLDKDSILYIDEFNTLELKLSEDTIQDLEIINIGKFTETVSLFIRNNELAPKNVLMILNAPLFFERTFKDQTDMETQTGVFLENIPFESISSKLIPDEKGSKLLATNRNFFMPVKTAFESESFKINLVLPYLAIEKLKLDVKKLIENNKTKEFKQKLKLLAQHNLLAETLESNPKKESQDLPIKGSKSSFSKIRNTVVVKNLKTKGNGLPVLLPVFLLLILILVALIISQSAISNSQSQKASTAGAVLVSPTSSSTSAQNTTAAQEKTASNTTITIAYNDDRLRIAKVFKDQLTQQGFKNITLINENSQGNTSKTYVAFSLNFPEKIKENITTEANKTFIDVAIQEINQTDSNVSIIVGEAR